jgi:translin
LRLKAILNRIEKELMEREDVKEDLYGAMRKATRLSKQAIFAIHQMKLEESKELLGQARGLFLALGKVPEAHRKLIHSGIVDAAFQEYAEAQIFLELIQRDNFISPGRIGAPAAAFLLGLYDVVGELRRLALDSLRRGDVEGANRSFKTMEQIHVAMVGMDEAMRAVTGLRRKSDVARRIIEITRGDISIDQRRSALEDSIQRLEDTLRKDEKGR